MFQKWDKRADVNNLGSAQWYIYYKQLKKNVDRLKLNYELPIPDSVIVSCLEHTQNFFMENFGKSRIVQEKSWNKRTLARMPACDLCIKLH